MTHQLIEIGQRIKTLREINGLSLEEMSSQSEISIEAYQAYEKGEKDFSFSFLSNVARVLRVDVVDLMSGDSPKLSTCTVVRKGGGFDIHRRESYNYKHLAFTFRNKIGEPFLVTVEPKSLDKGISLNSHGGQEFNYILEGEMTFFIGDISYILEVGDSIYFNATLPHGMLANQNRPCKFLAIVMNKES